MFEQAFIVIYGAAVRPDGSPSGAMRDRVGAAVRFGRRLLPQPIYIPTGATGRYGPAEAEVMTQLLLDRGVPADYIVPELTGTNTLRSTIAVARLLQGQPGPVYAATSAYHMPRCVLLLGLAGLDAHRSPPAIGAASSRLRKRWYWRMREFPALPLDAALMVWHRWRGFGDAPEDLAEDTDPVPEDGLPDADQDAEGAVMPAILARVSRQAEADADQGGAPDAGTVLERLASRHPDAPDWRTDITHLLAVLDVEPGPATRRALAAELDYPGDPDLLPALDAWLVGTLLHRLGHGPVSGP